MRTALLAALGLHALMFLVPRSRQPEPRDGLLEVEFLFEPPRVTVTPSAGALPPAVAAPAPAPRAVSKRAHILPSAGRTRPGAAPTPDPRPAAGPPRQLPALPSPHGFRTELTPGPPAGEQIPPGAALGPSAPRNTADRDRSAEVPGALWKPSGAALPGFRARVKRDGTLLFDDTPALGFDTLTSGRAELTDAVMRSLGQDPYQSAKLKLHKETRLQREAMAARARASDGRDVLRQLPARLSAVWGDATRPAIERRRLLFALWDECADDLAGQRARATILAFVRAQHIDYAAAELAALNARRGGREPFAP